MMASGTAIGGDGSKVAISIELNEVGRDLIDSSMSNGSGKVVVPRTGSGSIYDALERPTTSRDNWPLAPQVQPLARTGSSRSVGRSNRNMSVDVPSTLFYNRSETPPPLSLHL